MRELHLLTKALLWSTRKTTMPGFMWFLDLKTPLKHVSFMNLTNLVFSWFKLYYIFFRPCGPKSALVNKLQHTVLKLHSKTFLVKNLGWVLKITFTYKSIALKHAEDNYTWLINHTGNEQLNECMFFKISCILIYSM